MLTFPRERSLDFVALGRAAIDINPSDFSQSFAENAFFRKYVGGSPANTAIGLCRLGCRTGFIGKVSNDSLGSYVVDFLRTQGVDTSRIVRGAEGELNGMAFTEIRPDGTTNLMMYRDEYTADMRLCASEIDEAYLADTKCLIVSGCALAASPSREAAFWAILLARKHGTSIVFDLDYRPQIWKDKREVAVYYTLVAQQADVLMGSREEFDRMNDGMRFDEGDAATASYWFGHRAEIIIIKHGKKGSSAYCRNGCAYAVKSFPVNALKSTGGGDAFSSALLSGLLHELPMERVLERATASASIAVSADNCSEALPDERQLISFIQEGRARGISVVEPIVGGVMHCS